MKKKKIDQFSNSHLGKPTQLNTHLNDGVEQSFSRSGRPARTTGDKYSRLGRGLDSLIPIFEEEKDLKIINIGKIAPNPIQPRENFDEEKLGELALSIKEHGILQPLIVAPREDGNYEIIAGERRWRAALKAGLGEIPVMIRDAHQKEKLEIALIENLQRDDLNPLEEAKAYDYLIKDFNLTQEEVSKKLGKSRSKIANNLRLLDLPLEIKEGLKQNLITEGHAKAILGEKDPEKQLQLYRAILDQGLNVREAEKRTAKIKASKKSSKIHPEISSFLREVLGTKVEIVPKKRGGTILIEYYSQEELDRIIDTLKSYF